MKQHFLIFIVTFLCACKIYAQKSSISNNDIFIQISKDSLHKDSILIDVKNLSEKNIMFSMIDGVNNAKYNPRYIGIGLYSALFPYVPEYIAKYSNELNMKVIKPKEKLLLKVKDIINLTKGYTFSFDYIIIDNLNKVNNNKITREFYDKSVVFLKFDFSN
jgi:hypothetical protein